VSRLWLESAVGPDGDRVSFIIEPRLDRLFHAMDEVAGYESVHLLPSLGELLGKVFDGDKQRVFLADAWLLRIEADSGVKVTLRVPSQRDAEIRGAAIAEQVRAHGVAALAGLA